MIFRSNYEKSFLPKSFIAAALFTSILVCSYLMFADESKITNGLQQYKISGDFFRHILLLSCFGIYFVRLLATLFIFFQRKMHWIEAIVIANVMPFVLPYIAVVGGNSEQPVGLLEIVGILVFLFGSYLNTRSEYLRHIWKQKEKNQGCLYVGGLFRSVRHINYLGDIILFTGMAMVANQFVLLVVPGLMAFIFITILIPLKENYLKIKYGKQFANYASKTKKLIPMIY